MLHISFSGKVISDIFKEGKQSGKRKTVPELSQNVEERVCLQLICKHGNPIMKECKKCMITMTHIEWKVPKFV